MIDPYDHIHDYLNGSLNKEQTAIFEVALKEDATLRAAIEHADVLTDVTDALIEEEVETAIAALEPSEEERPGYGRIWIFIIGALIAALAVWYFTRGNVPSATSEMLYAEVYTEPAWPITRSDNRDTLQKIISDYFAGDMVTSKNALQRLDHPDAQYWLSELYLKEQKPDSTLLYIPTVFSDNVRRDRVLFLEILSYDLKKDHKKVRQLIEELPDDMDGYYLDLLD